MSSTRISRHINAPRAIVYRALLDAGAVAKWKVPTGMTCHVHALDAREGGSFRISLTYDAPTGTGKTTAHTDTYRGRFVKLVPNEQVVEVDEFETEDPALRGELSRGTRKSCIRDEVQRKSCAASFCDRPRTPGHRRSPEGPALACS